LAFSGAKPYMDATKIMEGPLFLLNSQLMNSKVIVNPLGTAKMDTVLVGNNSTVRALAVMQNGIVSPGTDINFGPSTDMNLLSQLGMAGSKTTGKLTVNETITFTDKTSIYRAQLRTHGIANETPNPGVNHDALFVMGNGTSALANAMLDVSYPEGESA